MEIRFGSVLRSITERNPRQDDYVVNTVDSIHALPLPDLYIVIDQLSKPFTNKSPPHDTPIVHAFVFDVIQPGGFGIRNATHATYPCKKHPCLSVNPWEETRLKHIER